jgi:hypothetical protein
MTMSAATDPWFSSDHDPLSLTEPIAIAAPPTPSHTDITEHTER